MKQPRVDTITFVCLISQVSCSSARALIFKFLKEVFTVVRLAALTWREHVFKLTRKRNRSS